MHFKNKIEDIAKNIPQYSGDPLKGAKARAEKLNLKLGNFSINTVSEQEVVKAIKRSKPSNCPDAHGMSPTVLKIAPEVVAISLTWIINSVTQGGQVPQFWKEARVLPLHKKNEKHKVENYRPISILPSPSKSMEEIIQTQLSKYMEKHHIITQSQFGFRPGISTTMATGVANHQWQKAKLEKQACGALQFDLSAAFDTIDVDILLGKLKIYGASEMVLNLIRSYLTGCSQRVEYDRKQSETIYILIGSPQGSGLSPPLYLILVSDQGEWISNGFILVYADDTLGYIIAPTKTLVREGLETMAQEVLTFMQATRLKANPSKSKFIMFGSTEELPINIGESMVEESSETEFLGINFNKKLTWKSHLAKNEGELKKRTGILRRLSWHLPKFIVVQMIEPLFMSKLRYALELIMDATAPEDDQVFKKTSCFA